MQASDDTTIKQQPSAGDVEPQNVHASHFIGTTSKEVEQQQSSPEDAKTQPPKELTLTEVNQELLNVKSELVELKNVIISLIKDTPRCPLPKQLTRTKSAELASQTPYLDDINPFNRDRIPPEKFISVSGRRSSDSQLKYSVKK